MSSTGPTSAPTEVAVRAPGRVNLIGEHTDYNAGLCLPIAIAAQTTGRAVRLAPGAPSLLGSAQQPDAPWAGHPADAAPGRVGGWAAYAAGVLWALTEAGYEVPPMRLDLDSTVPLGAGLSSSASVEAAVAVAAVTLAGGELDEAVRGDLVSVCRRAEAEVAGAPTGGLDQAAVLLAEAGSAVLLDFADGARRAVPVDLAGAGLDLLVVDTRAGHAHTEGGYGDRRVECEAAATALGLGSLREADLGAVAALAEPLRRRARHIVTENTRVEASVAAVTEGDWTGFGRLLDDSHDSMRDDFEISSPELDLVVDVAREAGALGARMTGGGFGGSAIALVPVARSEAVRHAVDAAFVRAGYAAPAHLDGTPSAGAGLL